MQIHKLVFAAFGAAFFMSCAYAQNAGTVSNHAVPIGKGPGVQGFGSLALTSGQVIIGQSSADPQAKTLTGDVTVDNTGTTAIGANKVTNSQLATMPANTTKCNATAGAANPTDCIASTMRTNLGLVIGTNVQAWDADLDCIAALSSTGVISRTGAGTCSAGALALSGLATGTQDTVMGYFGGTTASATAVPNCSGALTYSTSTHTFGCGSGGTVTPVLASRAAAATQDLSAFSAVRTLGYAAAGDGGGATFVKVGAVPFRDSYATTGTVAGGSGYGINATYNGVRMGGGSGLGCQARVTVSGGAITTIDISTDYCAAYAVGDVLTPTNTDMAGTGSGASFTLTAVSTATASFNDSVGNKWQYVPDAEAFPNIRQFGAKLDWNGVDASATNDLSSFKSAMAFASIPFSSASALVNGTVIRIPKGAAYLCAGSAPFATLVVPAGVTILGPGPNGGATLKQCTGEDSSSHFISLCSPFARTGQMGCKLDGISVLADGASNSGVAAIYSSSGQQYPLINNVYIQPVGRMCIKYEIGTGGASNAIFDNFDCEVSSSTSNVSFSGNSSGTQIILHNAVFGCAPSNCASGMYAVNMVSGLFVVDGAHFEQYVNAINIATTSSSHLHSIRNVTINNGCVNGITISASNPNNTEVIENVQSSCSSVTVFNGHSGGSGVTGNIMGQKVFNP